MPRTIIPAHQVQPQGLHAIPGQRKADKAPAMSRHEIDGFRRRHLRRNHEIALILPVLVIDQNEHSSIASFVDDRSEEHTSELQSLMRISYAVFCLKKKTT